MSATLVLDASGVVLAGAVGADGATTLTTIRALEEGVFAEGIAAGAPVLRVGGHASGRTYGTPVAVDARVRVPAGTAEVPVEDAAGFAAGDEVVVEFTPNAAWVAALGMVEIGWTPGSYRIKYRREIAAVAGNVLTLDLPLTQALDAAHGGGQVYPYSHSGRVSHSGVRDLAFVSAYSDGPEDETHAWTAVHFDEILHGFAENLRCRHFGFACVQAGYHANHVTVKDCRSEAMVSLITGGRRYSFVVNGGSNLFTGCTADTGRHDFASGSRVPGPNVFHDCHATHAYADIGPHHR